MMITEVINRRVISVLLIVVAWQILMWSVSTAFGAGQYRYVLGEYPNHNFGVYGNTRVYNPTVRNPNRGHVVESQHVWYDSNNWYEVGWIKGLDGQGHVWNAPTFFIAWMINGVYGRKAGTAPGVGTDHYHFVMDSFLSGLPSYVWRAYIDDGTENYRTMSFNQATYCVAQSEVGDLDQMFTSTLNGYHWNLQYGSSYMSYFTWYNWTGTVWGNESPYHFNGHDTTWFKSGGP
jgi:hypothetical protein